MSGKEHDDGLDASFIISQAKSRNRPAAGVLLQFPFYAGIMGMMVAANDQGVSLEGHQGIPCGR